MLGKITYTPKYSNRDEVIYVDPTKIRGILKQRYSPGIAIYFEGMQKPTEIDNIDDEEFEKIAEQIENMSKRYEVYHTQNKWTK